jgi:uncharacterized protein (DUF1015 family)
MAEIKPLRAWRYNPYLSQNIDSLISPPFDCVSEKQRVSLYKNPYNSIHLSVPLGPDSANKATQLLQIWKENGIILQDKLPAIYVYYQYFKLAGSPKQYCRKGFICNIRICDWKETVILRHENTIPQSVNDRIELLEKTELNVSPTHGLYTDESFSLERYMDEAITSPIYDSEDYQGVREVMGIIQDAYVIQKFIDLLADKTIILADGHHRYESSLMYQKKMAKANLSPTGLEGYNFHMMFLTNTESDDLRILPTHRLINGIPNFDEEKVIEKLHEDFDVREIEDADTLNEIIIGKKWAFGILTKNHALKVKLRPESFPKLKWNFPLMIRELDLTVMHYFIIEKIAGIPGKEQRASENISFDRSFSDCLTKVLNGKVQLGIIAQDVSIEDIKAVCRSGYTMPQKSTYFYPKVICGYLFSSIKEDEFQTPPYSRF